MCGRLIRGVKQVLRKRWAYLWGGLCAGGLCAGGLCAGRLMHGEAYRQRNTVVK